MTDEPAEVPVCRFASQKEISAIKIQVNRWEHRPTNRPTDQPTNYTQQHMSKGGNRIQQGINDEEQIHGKSMHRNESGLKGDMLT